jgi:hypothetical protein
VLELLFQFIYPSRHPGLSDLKFCTLAMITEAAEKYEVFAAMNICEVRMRYVTTAKGFIDRPERW